MTGPDPTIEQLIEAGYSVAYSSSGQPYYELTRPGSSDVTYGVSEPALWATARYYWRSALIGGED